MTYFVTAPQMAGYFMSVGHPEAKILAEQMNQALSSKSVQSCMVKDCERLQRIGMMEKT